MNRQKPPGGIEWTRPVIHITPDFVIEMEGETWHVISGCKHDCIWYNDDGSVSECYAKTMAERSLAKRFYPHGFRHHYWRPDRLEQPLKKKRPSAIFAGSMADNFARYVPDEHIGAILDITRRADWHIFQFLTKYPIALQKWNPFPPNAWVGMSLPSGNNPDHGAARKRLGKDLLALREVEADVRFISFEPLWFNPCHVLEGFRQSFGSLPIEWAIIGATSQGRKIHQPDQDTTRWLIDMLREEGIPIFFKGNLQWDPWYEQAPLISHFHPSWMKYARPA